MAVKESLQKELTDDEFKAEYEALEPEFKLIKVMIGEREEQKISQR